MELVLFIVLGLTAVVAAIGVILSRNPVHSALFLLLNFAVLAAFYILLNAEFLAVAQVAVYAGAIVVLFLFVIMLISGEIGPLAVPGQRLPQAIGLLLAALILVGLIYAAVNGSLSSVRGTASPEAIAQIGNVQALGQTLYTRFLLPFEMASVLLLVAMVGAVVLARRMRE